MLQLHLSRLSVLLVTVRRCRTFVPIGPDVSAPEESGREQFALSRMAWNSNWTATSPMRMLDEERIQEYDHGRIV